jgi:hypothetical protein
MNEQTDEKWLDDELRRIVGGAAPEFDAQAWKRNHPAEFQAVLSRGASDRTVGRDRMARMVFAHPLVRVAAAAAIVVFAAVLFVGPGQRRSKAPVDEAQPAVRSPTEIVTMMSLRGAYRRGGAEALERQLDEALRVLRPRPAMISMHVRFDNSEG